MDIKLRQWANTQLPAQSVDSGWETLRTEFQHFMKKASEGSDHDGIFDQLKEAVVAEAMSRHSWEDKASEMLRVIQLNALEDRSISDKRDWDQAVKFLEISLKDKLCESETILKELLGPSAKERWLYWKSKSEQQTLRSYVKTEVDKILYSNEVSMSCLVFLIFSSRPLIFSQWI